MTTYIIESPNGETHKLEVFRTATGFSVYVDGSNICESITEEDFCKSLKTLLSNMVGVIIWLIVVLLICFSVFGGLWLLPIYLLFCLALGFYFGVKYLTI